MKPVDIQVFNRLDSQVTCNLRHTLGQTDTGGHSPAWIEIMGVSEDAAEPMDSWEHGVIWALEDGIA